MNSPKPIEPAKEATAGTSGPSFDGLPLPPHVRQNLQRLGYTAMTPIQAASLPLALAGTT
jgi:ATP-independent RNA helicase DbpA